MNTFDQILPITHEILAAHHSKIAQLDWLIVNRDLNGRVRFIVPEPIKKDEARRGEVEAVYQMLADQLGPHCYPPETGILYEANSEFARQGTAQYILSEFDQVWFVDRLATESNWACITPETQGATRVVFFSIKGGVGRSTALAASAWSLAQSGKRVLVLDLDLESPGLSSALLPPERQPKYGITDWLVEDLVGHAEVVLGNMVATSNLSHDGEIHVVPAHGIEHGEYIAKLGRVWMPKLKEDGTREKWSARLERLLQSLEARIRPDIILIDSRSGIDEIASACIADMGANLILLFALEGEQTWNGYRMLFEQWLRAGVAQKVRERLQVVGAVVPDFNRVDYLAGLREHSYEVFGGTLYDNIEPAAPDTVGPTKPGDPKTWRVGTLVEGWNFDEADEGAPHHPWAVNWHRSFAGLRSLQGRLAVIDAQEVQAVFGSLIDGMNCAVEARQTL